MTLRTHLTVSCKDKKTYARIFSIQILGKYFCMILECILMDLKG